MFTTKPEIITCQQLWDIYWLGHIEKRLGHSQSQRFAWANLGVHFGRIAGHDVDQAEVDLYEDLRRQGVIGRPSVPSTIRRELAALGACLRWCSRRGLVPASVTVWDLPPDGEPRDRWLRREELDRLFAAATAARQRWGGPHSVRIETASGSMLRSERLSRVERFLWLALETAARKRAIFELTWDRVDLEVGVIHYPNPEVRKTKKRRVSVPISSTLRPIIERAHRERIGDLVLDNMGEVWKLIQPIAEEAGVEGVSPNVLRHTAATLMARAGVPLWLIAGVLGNTLAMVERVYAKHQPDGLITAVEKISGGGR